MAYLTAEPASKLTFDGVNKSALITLGDPAREVTVANLIEADVMDLMWEIPMLYDAFLDPQNFGDLVFSAITALDQDVVTKREIALEITSYFDDVIEAIELADIYRRDYLDNDESKLIGRDAIDQALDCSLRYLKIGGTIGLMLNANKEVGRCDPPGGIYLTKMGHTLKEMMIGTEPKVSIG